MNAQKTINTIKELFVKQGYTITVQREATIRVLLEHEEEALSSEEIFFRVKNNCPDIGIATVYRSLDLLIELGIVKQLNFRSGVVLFDLCSNE